MCNKIFPLSCIPFIFSVLVLTCTFVRSQIVPDTTLGAESSIVTPDPSGRSVNVIEGGATRGTNLFHSFEQFSVLTGRTALFNNAVDIQNIISRVTGSSISNIDGLLQANGTANLFLINPNGIIFGPNASLNINGSFLASTASSLNFTDGNEFSATAPLSTPLLTISVPIGLRFTTGNPEPINVEGYGHNLFTIASVGAPVLGSSQSLTGLRTQPGKTIALVGGQVNFDGGTLTTPSGRIEVGSVATGLVGINSKPNGLFLSYDKVHSYQDIQLDEVSLLDASGFFNGDISLQGRNVTLTNASLAIVSNFGDLPSGKIIINATEKLEVTGIKALSRSINSNVTLARGIVTQNFSHGKGADIVVSSGKLSVHDFGGIGTQTYGFGSGGNISLTVKDSTQIFSDLVLKGLTVGAIATYTSGDGRGGDLSLSTKELSIEDGGIFAAESFKSGDGGNVTINASTSVKISGGTLIDFDDNFANNSFWPSFSGALTTSSGNAGNVVINTKHLTLENGGRLDSSTLASGSAGNLTINAVDSINVSGRAPGFSNPTLIISSANVVDPFFTQLFTLPSTLDGESGYVTINTNRLSIRDGAQISVRNDGNKNAGNLQISANSISLDNKGGITASTASGQGGNIFLQAENFLLRNNSTITATAGGSGNGGNITIDTGTLAALENSDISANAQKGFGGQVIINAQGIFGTEFRDRQTPGSDITATGGSPQLSGSVQINTQDVDPSQGLVALPEEPVDVTGLIAQGCAGSAGPRASKFVVTGRGGLPDNPNEKLNNDTLWTDSRLITPAESQLSSPPANTQPNDSAAAPLVEADGWVINSKGEVVLTATAPSATLQVPSPSGCHAS